ncbi:MAG: Cof-type HAD-IIB family hydrolase [Thiohalocapsa sp.]
MYKLVVSDLDGTLLGPDHRLGDYTRAALARLRAAGVELILASGRHFMDVRALAAQFGSDGCLITCNGAAVNDGQGRLMRSRCIDRETVEFLLRDPLFASVHTNVFLTNAWLVEQPAPELLRYHQESGFRYQVVDFGALRDLEVLKVFYYGEHEHLQQLEADILQRAGGRLGTTFSLPQTLEVMATDVTKGTALGMLLEGRGVSPADVICFGDGLNDFEMLSLVANGQGKALLMDNADPRLHADLPELEVIGSNRDESVARHLDALLQAGQLGGR